MKKFLLATTLLAVSAFAGNAADLPRKSAPVYKPVVALPSFVWTGFYVGVNGGWDRHYVAIPGIRGAASNGIAIGGTVGYNYQLQNNIVLGVEGDLDYLSNNYTRSNVVAANDRLKLSGNYLGTIRGRIGYALNAGGIPLLPYITGGVAFGGTDLRYTNPIPANNLTRTNNSVGYTVGGGIEAQVYQNWTAKVEYLYSDFGTRRFGPVGKTQVDDHTVRVGLNYKFN